MWGREEFLHNFRTRQFNFESGLMTLQLQQHRANFNINLFLKNLVNFVKSICISNCESALIQHSFCFYN